MNTTEKVELPTAIVVAAISRILGSESTSAIMLYHLIAYPHHTYSIDGMISKTYAEWYRELGIKESLCRRSLETLKRKGLVEVVVKKRPDGAPTLHFRVNVQVVRDQVIKSITDFNGDHHD